MGTTHNPEIRSLNIYEHSTSMPTAERMFEALHPFVLHTQCLSTQTTHCRTLRDLLADQTFLLVVEGFEGSEVRRERSEFELERVRRQEQSPKVLVIEIALFAHQNGICI